VRGRVRCGRNHQLVVVRAIRVRDNVEAFLRTASLSISARSSTRKKAEAHASVIHKVLESGPARTDEARLTSWHVCGQNADLAGRLAVAVYGDKPLHCLSETDFHTEYIYG
jgi:hypothetical protein